MTNDVVVRVLMRSDADEALKLYNNLTAGPRARDPEAFVRVLDHVGTDIYGAMMGHTLISMATLHLLPNVTWDARPYGLIENVITKAAYRRMGYGRMVMEHAIAQAWRARAHKIMLMTGQRLGAREFYEAVGFSSDQKHAMILHAL